ncbi:MAG: CHAT domain-containing protein [Gemmatimonadetes bacterium]|nr:MAG: CHAT domain-containing protein [Gemmatimonadota bacterium]
MSLEFRLTFPEPTQVILRAGSHQSPVSLGFTDPFPVDEKRAMYQFFTASPPFDTNQLVQWGTRLAQSVFLESTAHDLFLHFLKTPTEDRRLIIASDHPEILSLPWELLTDLTANDTFLAQQTPPISIQRAYVGLTPDQKAFYIPRRSTRHVLVMMSRPHDVPYPEMPLNLTTFKETLSRPGLTVEILESPTFEALVDRLDNRNLPAVDIFHFDGPGYYDRDDREGSIIENHHPYHAYRDQILKGMVIDPVRMAYVVLEKRDGSSHRLSAKLLGQMLYRHRVALTILTTPQRVEPVNEPFGCIGSRLISAGVPAVIAIPYALRNSAKMTFFEAFYQQLTQGLTINHLLDHLRQKGDVYLLPSLYRNGDDITLLTR